MDDFDDFEANGPTGVTRRTTVVVVIARRMTAPIYTSFLFMIMRRMMRNNESRVRKQEFLFADGPCIDSRRSKDIRIIIIMIMRKRLRARTQ